MKVLFMLLTGENIYEFLSGLLSTRLLPACRRLTVFVSNYAVSRKQSVELTHQQVLTSWENRTGYEQTI
jgi:hypothetical protein